MAVAAGAVWGILGILLQETSTWELNQQPSDDNKTAEESQL